MPQSNHWLTHVTLKILKYTEECWNFVKFNPVSLLVNVFGHKRQFLSLVLHIHLKNATARFIHLSDVSDICIHPTHGLDLVTLSY